MDSVWFGIAAFFEGLFKFLPPTGGLANILFCVIGFVSNAIWIWYIMKNPDKVKTNKMEDLYPNR